MLEPKRVLDCSVSGGVRDIVVDPVALDRREAEVMALAAFLQGFSETLDSLEESGSEGGTR